MNVAIMGAGLSGLACAITLERYGVYPAIFESRTRVGDRFVNAETLYEIINRPYNHCLDYLKENYRISLSPIGTVKKMVVHSKNEVGAIEGNIGVINTRGRHEKSFEIQLGAQVKSKIEYNSKHTYEDLKNGFEHVVLAPGDGAYASKLNNYRCDLTITIKGATVEGEFDPTATAVWFNREYVPKGYAYLIPYSKSEANIVLAYPDYPENRERDLNAMWEQFFDQACRDVEQRLKITDRFEITRYIVGVCERPKTGNTYFVGNCFGALTPAAGFGQFAAILTGIYAAMDLCGEGDYEELTKPLLKNYENSLVIRRALEKLDDDAFDRAVRHLDGRLIGKWVDKAVGGDTEFDFLKLISLLLRPVIK